MAQISFGIVQQRIYQGTYAHHMLIKTASIFSRPATFIGHGFLPTQHIQRCFLAYMHAKIAHIHVVLVRRDICTTSLFFSVGACSYFLRGSALRSPRRILLPFLGVDRARGTLVRRTPEAGASGPGSARLSFYSLFIFSFLSPPSRWFCDLARIVSTLTVSTLLHHE